MMNNVVMNAKDESKQSRGWLVEGYQLFSMTSQWIEKKEDFMEKPPMTYECFKKKSSK